MLLLMPFSNDKHIIKKPFIVNQMLKHHWIKVTKKNTSFSQIKIYKINKIQYFSSKWCKCWQKAKYFVASMSTLTKIKWNSKFFVEAVFSADLVVVKETQELERSRLHFWGDFQFVRKLLIDIFMGQIWYNFKAAIWDKVF
jgi:hypothetical protein